MLIEDFRTLGGFLRTKLALPDATDYDILNKLIKESDYGIMFDPEGRTFPGINSHVLKMASPNALGIYDIQLKNCKGVTSIKFTSESAGVLYELSNLDPSVSQHQIPLSYYTGGKPVDKFWCKYPISTFIIMQNLYNDKLTITLNDDAQADLVISDVYAPNGDCHRLSGNYSFSINAKQFHGVKGKCVAVSTEDNSVCGNKCSIQ